MGNELYEWFPKLGMKDKLQGFQGYFVLTQLLLQSGALRLDAKRVTPAWAKTFIDMI